jgi:hypothetical protein
MNQVPRIDTYKYFKYVFGFSEKTIEEVLTRCSVEERDDGDVFIRCPKGLLRAGRFRVMSVNELRKEAESIPSPERKGSFSIINGNGIRSRKFEDIDVGAIQVWDSIFGCVFFKNLFEKDEF